MSDRRPQFGNRFLVNKEDIFKHNAWDNVQWNENQEKSALQKVKDNSEVRVPPSEMLELEKTASRQWDAFYSVHQNRFFKDRHWLMTEFPELSSCEEVTETAAGSEDPGQYKENKKFSCSLNDMRRNEKYIGENATKRILEVGCGVGNTVFPILDLSRDRNMFLYCCDFSRTAIDILEKSENYDKSRCKAFVYDLTSLEEQEVPFPEASLDIITCLFVLSALQPEKIDGAVKRLSKYLKPGGLFLFRDYGRYDMAQLRFKKGKCLGDNFYAREDGTRVYFFTQEDVRQIMDSAGLKELQNHVDRRLQINRGKQLSMYRVWIQARYQKTCG